MKITLSKYVHTLYGTTLEEYSPATVFVTDDRGRVHVNPEIIEADDDCVVFEYYGEEVMGTAVALATMTPEEALRIAMKLKLRAIIGKQEFAWWPGNRRHSGQWCAGFRKKRGTRTHLVPASFDDCLELIEGTKKIVYWTNSRRCDIVAA